MKNVLNLFLREYFGPFFLEDGIWFCIFVAIDGENDILYFIEDIFLY